MHSAKSWCIDNGLSWSSLNVSSAAPSPPTLTVTALYDCGGLLEIKSQATETGVGCDVQ